LAPGGVEFLGAVDAAIVPGLLAEARALLLPSQSYEGSPRAVVEAMAAGVPVLGSDIGGIPEHVESGVNGLLVPPTDVRAWATAIDRLRDDQLSTQLGKGAYDQWQSHFSPEAGLASLEHVYRKAIRLHAR
jgi:glycosyltransferase involved in cell wall biosynthesis